MSSPRAHRFAIDADGAAAAAYAVELGAAEADEMAAIADAWARWAEHPSAFVAHLWITATGWAPS